MKLQVPIAALALTFLLSGCTLGPHYQRPAVSVAHDWFAPEKRGIETTEPVAEWWSTFNDPKLDELVKRAAQNNLDLQLATARIAEARAAHTII